MKSKNTFLLIDTDDIFDAWKDNISYVYLNIKELKNLPKIFKKYGHNFAAYVINASLESKYLNLEYMEQYKVLYNSQKINTENSNYFKSINGVDTKNISSKSIIDLIDTKFFAHQYGISVPPSDIININKHGAYFGQDKYVLNILSDQKEQIFWSQQFYQKKDTMEIWLEYEKDVGVEIHLKIISKSLSEGIVLNEINLSENEIKQPIVIPEDGIGKYITCFLLVKGEGTIKIGNLHYRQHRQHTTEMIPGGERIVDLNREELFVYYNQGNLKPPLNVYFSGYRSLEGFEGYPMLRDLKHPFILVSDPRLEGGKFYLSNRAELSRKLISYIKGHLDKLGFKSDDLILSGLSMGTSGALFYASHLKPRYVFLGKPLLNLKSIANNGVIKRSDDFSTSFDVVTSLKLTNDNQLLKLIDINKLNNTKFTVIYMKQDDYDGTAFQDLKGLFRNKVKLTGLGFEGRHNDDTNRVVEWFLIYWKEALDEWNK